jgi:DNA-binding SARP family transcriptional activator
MQVRLLGPVDVLVDGTSTPVRGLRRTAVLAVLAVQSGDIVSVDRLIDAVWPDQPPSTAANTVQSHISHLRQVLGSRTAILARPPGYLLDIGGDATDVRAAERMIHSGNQLLDPAARTAQLRAALALWRGQPLANLAELTGQLPWLDEQVERMHRLRLEATRGLVDARLAVGEHVQLVPELERLIRDHPFDELIHAQFILALYRSGRQAEALSAYQRLRRALSDDLGIDPGRTLRDLETAILRQDPELDLLVHAARPVPQQPVPHPVPHPAAEPGLPPPAQLPATVPGFSGRTAELAALDSALVPAPRPGTPGQPGVVVATISGSPGTGKTALAVHWAHRAAGHFPDGQLYVNLRGFDPAGQVMDSGEAVHRFLDALGVPAQRVPADLDARAALYRSALAGKRMLILLDNARDEEQVRPLLPGAAGSLVLVTSRSWLPGLVAGNGARAITLDLLSYAEARDMLIRRLGADRVSAEQRAVEEIIRRCARLPLALAIVAARAATYPHLPLLGLAASLRDVADRLDALASDDPHTDVRAVFSWSYRALTLQAARLFRLLGLHPGPDFAAPAVASLAAIPPARVRPLLAELAAANLISEHVPGRYTCHDLLRVYAADLTETEDGPAEREAASRRLLDHLLHTAHAADRLLRPGRDSIALAAPEPGITPEPLADHQRALAWFTAERPVLLAAVQHAAVAGLDTHTWQLVWTMWTFLDRTGHWHDQSTAGQAALVAGMRLGDPSAQGRALRVLAGADSHLGRIGDSYRQLWRALDLHRRAGDRLLEAHTHHTIGYLYGRQDRIAEAAEECRKALALYRQVGNRLGEADALNSVGWFDALLGDYGRALTSCQRALALLQELGDQHGQALTWDSVGYAQHHLGHYPDAVASYRRALELFRSLGDRHHEATALTDLGDTHESAGNREAALDCWRYALLILTDLEHSDAEAVRTRLSAVTVA